MTSLVFESPSHENGGCIFADPSELVTTTPSDCSIIFEASMHENGGCIFDNPAYVAPTRRRRSGSGGFGLVPWPEDLLLEQAKREDEELLIMISAFMEMIA